MRPSAAALMPFSPRVLSIGDEPDPTPSKVRVRAHRISSVRLLEICRAMNEAELLSDTARSDACTRPPALRASARALAQPQVPRSVEHGAPSSERHASPFAVFHRAEISKPARAERVEMVPAAVGQPGRAHTARPSPQSPQHTADSEPVCSAAARYTATSEPARAARLGTPSSPAAATATRDRRAGRRGDTPLGERRDHLGKRVSKSGAALVSAALPRSPSALPDGSEPMAYREKAEADAPSTTTSAACLLGAAVRSGPADSGYFNGSVRTMGERTDGLVARSPLPRPSSAHSPVPRPSSARSPVPRLSSGRSSLPQPSSAVLQTVAQQTLSPKPFHSSPTVAIASPQAWTEPRVAYERQYPPEVMEAWCWPRSAREFIASS
jgi:hypothetical protein